MGDLGLNCLILFSVQNPALMVLKLIRKILCSENKAKTKNGLLNLHYTLIFVQ